MKKNKNLKLSNFVMKLGVISIVAGTVATVAGISGIKMDKSKSISRDNLQTRFDDVESTSSSLDKGILNQEKDKLPKEQFNRLNGAWETRIQSSYNSKSVISTSSPLLVSRRTIDDSPLKVQDVKNIKYDFETTNSEQPFSIDTKTYNSNIKRMMTMFEDSYHNLWSMGSGTPIQTFDYKTHTWISQPVGGPTKSNIGDGEWGAFFQDSEGTLWSIGSDSDGTPDTPLQKFNYGKNHSVSGGKWEEQTAATGSKILNGSAGTIYEDSHKILWAFGTGDSFQRLDLNQPESTRKWISEDSEGSNFKNGHAGIILEDSHGTLWSAGDGALQKYDYTNKTWSDAGEGSNIKSGSYGTIFEDSHGIVWTIGDGALQKYDYSNPGWEDQSANGSKITYSSSGKIFEDSHGNLWALGGNSYLEKYDRANQIWVQQTKTNSGSNIQSLGDSGNIFEDSQGILYSDRNGGKGQFLQQSLDGGLSWEQVPGVVTKPCINGFGNRNDMFEDSHGILWHSSAGAPLQFKLPGSKYWSHTASPVKPPVPNEGSNVVPKLFEDSYATLWAATSSGIQSSTDGGETWTDHKLDKNVNFVGTTNPLFLEDKEHNFLWVMSGSQGGISQYDYSTHLWIDQTNSGSKIKDGDWGQMFLDSKGVLWSTGQGSKLQKYNYVTKKWEEQNKQNSGSELLDGYVSVMFEVDGKVWVGSQNEGFQSYDNGVWVRHNLPINSGYTGRYCIDPKDKNLWLVTQGGVMRYDPSTGWKAENNFDKAVTLTDLVNGKIIVDSYGTVWFLAMNAPLQKYNNISKRWEAQTPDPNVPGSSNITNGMGGTIFQDSHGTLWSLGSGTCIQRSDDGKNWYDAPMLKSQPKNTYTSDIFEDSAGTIWFSRQGESLTCYRYPDSKSNNIIGYKGSISLQSFHKDDQLYLNSIGIKKFLKTPGVKIQYSLKDKNTQIDWTNKPEWNGDTFKIEKYGIYDFHFSIDPVVASISKNSLPKDFTIEFNKIISEPDPIKMIVKQPLTNGSDGTLGYGAFTNPPGAKLQVSIKGGVFKNADEKGSIVHKQSGSLEFKWKLDDYCRWDSKKEPIMRKLIIGNIFPDSGDIDKNYEDIIESKVQHIFKDVNFDFEDWTTDSFNALKSNTIKHIKLSNSTNDLTADLEVQIHADSEHKLSYKILKIQYDTKGTKISSDFYPVITKELMGAKGYITPSDDLSTQQEVQEKVLANTKKELTDALGKITFDKVNDTAYQALVKNLPATWNPASKKFTSSHQDYKIEVKKSVDSKNGKILLKFSVFQNGSTSPVAKDQIVISGFLGLSQLEKQQSELTKAIKDIADKTFGVDEITTGVFNADLNKITKKITIDGYAKTKAELTVHIKASADDKISYTVDPNVILKDANTNIKENIAQNTYNTIKAWKDDITLKPGFLSFADIKNLVTDRAIKDKMDSEYKAFALSTKISIKINANYNLELVLDTSVASTSELRYVISSYELKYNGNSLPEAQKSSELQTLLGTGKKISVSTSVAKTFPALVEMSTIATSPIDDYIVDKFKYFDFQDWTVDSFNAQPSNKTRTITIYGKNDNVAYVTIEVKATSENRLSYKVTKTEVKINNVVQTGPAFTSILGAFGKQTGTIDTPESLRTEKEAQLKAADKAKDDMRIAIDKMTFDKAELPSESKPKVFAGWKGKDKYEAYHQEFDVTYKQVAKDSTGEIIVTSTVAPFTKTGPKKCTPESVTNTISGFMGITQLTNMQSKVKQAILDKFTKQDLNELTSYFFNKDPKSNIMEVPIDGFGDTTAELTLKLDATADDKLSYTVTDVVVKNGIKVVPDSIAGNAISELKKWTGDVDLNPGFLTEEEYEKNLVIKNFRVNPNELASEVINAKNTGVSKAVKGEYEFENDDFRIDYTPDDETGEVLGKVTRKGSSSNVQETISGFLKFQAFVDAVTTKDLESKLLSALDNYEDSKTFNFEINDDYALELTVAVLPKDDNTISYSASGFDVKHNGKSLSGAQNSATLKALLKMKGDINIPKTNTKLLDVIYEKLHGESRHLDMSQLTKAASIPKPKPTIDLNEVTKELGEFYVSGEQSGSAKLLEENNAPDAAGFEFEFQVIDDEKPLSEPTKTLPVNLKNGEHVKITSVLKDGYQVKGKMPEKDVAVKGFKEHTTVNAASLTKATEIKEIPETKEVPEVARPTSKSNGLMIGLVVAGSVTGLILIGLLALMIVKKRKKRT